MTDVTQQDGGNMRIMPRWWRWFVLSAATVALSACQMPDSIELPVDDSRPRDSVLVEQPAVDSSAEAAPKATNSTLPLGGSDAAAAGEGSDIPELGYDQPSPLVPRDPPEGRVNSGVDVEQPPVVIDNEHCPSYEVTDSCATTYGDYPALPPSAFTGRPGDGYTDGRIPWAPPNIRRPWPRDEYLHDGGDHDDNVHVMPNWDVRGLDVEDTVVHFDTLDGRTLVEPSNRVDIYAPRFASVRRISGIVAHEGWSWSGRLDQPTHLADNNETTPVTAMHQPRQLNAQIGRKGPTTYFDPTIPRVAENDQGPAGFDGALEWFENFQVVRTGEFDEAEKARLKMRIDAATAWTTKDSVSVFMEDRLAAIDTADSRPQETVKYVLPPGKQRVEIVKLASKKHAKPGEIIDFTIRFDNRGDQVIGNVTILDNLTARLEYVAESAQCSLEADFYLEENERGSHVLRWEVIDPLDVGDGGIIRFKCRVR
jgi:uncharacterized repeat protein (TIGR01451 family)